MMKAVSYSGLKVYSLSAGKSLPQFIEDARKTKKASLRHDVDFRRRVELLQDFEFPDASTKVRVSPNGEYIAAVGVYPPEVRMYDTKQLSLKFSRRLESDVVDFQILSEDYKKLVMLEDDKTVEFHAQGGRYHKVKLQGFGCSLSYSPRDAELYICSTMNEVYRLDLFEGKFNKPLTTSACENLSCVFVNPVFPMVAAGGSGSIVECWDTRMKKSAAVLHVNRRTAEAGISGRASAYLGSNTSITAGAFSPDGMFMAVGDSMGVVKVFDIRSKHPIATRDHRNLEKINEIAWLSCANIPLSDKPYEAVPSTLEDSQHTRRSESSLEASFLRTHTNTTMTNRLLVSSDCRGIRCWNEKDGSLLASIESGAIASEDLKRKNRVVSSSSSELKINGFCFYPGSGLCFVPCDQKRIGTFFVPFIGLAPKWCSYLDSMTEELEEAAVKREGGDSAYDEAASMVGVFDEYQFVTREQLEQLGVSQLIGTPMLRSYMHGFFMDAELYRKIKAVAEPFNYEEYRKQKIKEKIEARKPMRIQLKTDNKEHTVNKELENKLMEVAEDAKLQTLTKKKRKVAEEAKKILSDSRFEKLFINPDFAMEAVDLKEAYNKK